MTPQSNFMFLMPIENNGVLWPEKLSPRVSIATLRLPKQKFDSPAQMEFARKLSYNPWHTITDHRPLGNQSRARRRMYFELSQLRHNMNNVPHYEPTGDEVFEQAVRRALMLGAPLKDIGRTAEEIAVRVVLAETQSTGEAARRLGVSPRAIQARRASMGS